MDSCIFCQIAAGKNPAFKVYENDKFVAALDIYPANKGHVILFPKEHRKTVNEMDFDEHNMFFNIARGVAGALIDMKAEGVNYVYSIGELAGQRTEHMLMHIIPRYKDDKVHLVWEPKKFTPEEFKGTVDEVAGLISKNIKSPKKEEKVIELPKPPDKVYQVLRRTGGW